eukprot:2734136-Amphidinium_carterae.1
MACPSPRASAARLVQQTSANPENPSTSGSRGAACPSAQGALGVADGRTCSPARCKTRRPSLKLTARL